MAPNEEARSQQEYEGYERRRLGGSQGHCGRRDEERNCTPVFKQS